jgi:hypothetical protein
MTAALIAGALLVGYLAGRRSTRRALQTTDGRMRRGIPPRTPTVELAVVRQLHALPDTEPMPAQRRRTVHA